MTVPPIAELDERHRGAWVIVQHPRRGQLVGWLFDAPSAAFELPAGHRRLYIDQPSGAVTVCDLPDSDVVELVTG